MSANVGPARNSDATAKGPKTSKSATSRHFRLLPETENTIVGVAQDLYFTAGDFEITIGRRDL